MVRSAILFAALALMLSAPLQAAKRDVTLNTSGSTFWLRCNMGATCKPQAQKQTATTTKPAPKPTTTHPWIKNK